MTSRIQIAYDSLKRDELDKNVVNVISELTAEEWIYIIGQKEAHGGKLYSAFLPFLIYTYNSQKADEIIAKSSVQILSRALVDAWFSVIYNGTAEKDHQPTFSALATKPVLLHVFEGHMLRSIEQADYNDDISSFMSEKFKMLLNEYAGHLTAKHGTSIETKKLLIGSSPSSPFPPLTDYSLDRIEKVNQFVLFLRAVELCVEAMQVTSDEEYNRSLIAGGRFAEIIKKNSSSVKSKYRNERQFSEAFEYVSNNFKANISFMSVFMLNQLEQELVAFVYKEQQDSGEFSDTLNGLTASDETEDFELNLDLLNCDNDDTSLIAFPSHENVKAKEESRASLTKWLHSLFNNASKNKPDSAQEKPPTSSKPSVSNESDDDYEAIVISAKKKSGNAPIITIFLCILTALVAVGVTAGGDSKRSIIDSSLTHDEASQAGFKTIINR